MINKTKIIITIIIIISIIIGVIYFNTTNLARSNLAASNLAGSNLAGSNLAGSQLAGSQLAGSNLAGSQLAGSNLAGSQLAGSNLAGSQLAGSNLAGSNLAGSQLAGSNLAASNLASSNLVKLQLLSSKLAAFDLTASNLKEKNKSQVVTKLNDSILWIDATDLLLENNSLVIEWTDKNNLNSTNHYSEYSEYPIYINNGFNNLPTVQFNTKNILSYNIPQNTFSDAITIFAVFQSLPSTHNNQCIFSRSYPNTHPSPFAFYGNRYLRGTLDTYTFGNTQQFNLKTVGLYILCIQADTNSVKEWVYSENFYKNRPEQFFFYIDNKNSAFEDKSELIFVGSRSDYNKNVSFNGYISEMIIYNTIMNDNKRQSIEGYLAKKWNLSNNLPDNHLYKI